MRHHIITLALLGLTTGYASASEKVENGFSSTPLKIAPSGHPYVYANIQGIEDYPLVVDTGTEAGVLPESMIENLNIPVDSLITQEIPTATGNVEMLTAYVNKTSVSGKEISNIEYIFHDMPKPILLSNGLEPGILGHNFLKNFCVEFDFPNNSLNLAKGGCPNYKTKDLRDVNFNITNQHIELKANFSGIETDVVLDTGGQYSMINNKLFKKLKNPTLGKSISATGASGKEMIVQEIKNMKYKIGEHEVTERAAFVGDLPIFNELGYGDKPFINLGIDYFKNGKLIIDYENQVMYF